MNTAKPIKLAFTALGASVMLTISTIAPFDTASATMPQEELEARQIYQKLTTVVSDEQEIHTDVPAAEISHEWVAEQDRIKAEEEKRAREEAARTTAAAAAAQANSAGSSIARVFADIPPGQGAQGLMNAALAQIGVGQDCTDLVQNSLAAVGLTQTRANGGSDLGTGIWQYDRFGTRVDINSLAPGDILIYGNASSGAHVAIYIGNGQAVHGGWAGYNTQIGPVNVHLPLTGAIRI